VFSFDYDTNNVPCSREMKRRFAPSSKLDNRARGLRSMKGMFGRSAASTSSTPGVYCTTPAQCGKALDLATIPAKGKILIAIYNEQGLRSRVWKAMYPRDPSAPSSPAES
jgi:hypothetical protein